MYIIYAVTINACVIWTIHGPFLHVSTRVAVVCQKRCALELFNVPHIATYRDDAHYVDDYRHFWNFRTVFFFPKVIMEQSLLSCPSRLSRRQCVLTDLLEALCANIWGSWFKNLQRWSNRRTTLLKSLIQWLIPDIRQWLIPDIREMDESDIVDDPVPFELFKYLIFQFDPDFQTGSNYQVYFCILYVLQWKLYFRRRIALDNVSRSIIDTIV